MIISKVINKLFRTTLFMFLILCVFTITSYNNEKTYEALEDECLVLQDKIEKKDEYIEQLEEVIENLRRK